MTEVYYFGCWREPGHYLYSPHGRRHGGLGSLPIDFPCSVRVLDGGLLPPRAPQTQGAAAHVHLHGWTILSFWDRSGDTRPQSCSTFLLRGLFAFHEACKQAREAFPAVWARYPFPVVAVGQGGESGYETEVSYA